MMTPTVLTLPIEEAEILLTLMRTLGPKIETIETTTVDEEAPD
jgi:hypothetical protein